MPSRRTELAVVSEQEEYALERSPQQVSAGGDDTDPEVPRCRWGLLGIVVNPRRANERHATIRTDPIGADGGRRPILLARLTPRHRVRLRPQGRFDGPDVTPSRGGRP